MRKTFYISVYAHECMHEIDMACHYISENYVFNEETFITVGDTKYKFNYDIFRHELRIQIRECKLTEAKIHLIAKIVSKAFNYYGINFNLNYVCAFLRKAKNERIMKDKILSKKEYNNFYALISEYGIHYE